MSRKTKDKPPLPTVIKRGGRLVPETAWDAEMLDSLPEGTILATVERSLRGAAGVVSSIQAPPWSP